MDNSNISDSELMSKIHEANRNIYTAIAIVDLISAVDPDELSDNTIHSAGCHALDLMKEVREHQELLHSFVHRTLKTKTNSATNPNRPSSASFFIPLATFNKGEKRTVRHLSTASPKRFRRPRTDPR